MVGPSGTRLALSTSKNSRTPFTSTCILCSSLTPVQHIPEAAELPFNRNHFPVHSSGEILFLRIPSLGVLPGTFSVSYPHQESWCQFRRESRMRKPWPVCQPP